MTTSPVLSASEIGEYVFCPQAWHLQRQQAGRTLSSTRNLDRGRLAHRGIGQRVDRIRRTEWLQRTLLLLIAVLAAGLVVQVLSTGSSLRP